MSAQDFTSQLVNRGFQQIEAMQPTVEALTKRVGDPNNPTPEKDAAMLARLRLQRKIIIEVLHALHEAENRNIQKIFQSG